MSGISSERIASIEAKKHELADAMSAGDLPPDEFVRLSKDYAAIEPVANAAREVRRLRAELEVLEGLLHDPPAEAELKDRGRVLVRYSGTQNMCRVMVEGPTVEETERHARRVADAVKSAIG